MTTNQDLVLLLARSLYGREPRIESLSQQHSAVFRLRFPDRSVIVKLAKSNENEPLHKEIMLFELLERYGIPTPSIDHEDVAGTLVGRPFVIMQSAGEQTVADSLFKQDTFAGPLFAQMGGLLAKIHSVNLAPSVETLRSGIEGRDSEEYRRKMARLADWCVEEKLLELPEAERFKALPVPGMGGNHLCHGDFHAVHCIVDQGRITAVVDWESAWPGAPGIDLAVTHAYLDYYCPLEMVRSFFAGYVGVHPLQEEYARDSLPARMGQTLAMLRVWHHQGLEQNVRRVLELFRAYAQRI